MFSSGTSTVLGMLGTPALDLLPLHKLFQHSQHNNRSRLFTYPVLIREVFVESVEDAH